MVNLVTTRTFRAFSAKLLSSWLLPNLYCYMQVFSTYVRDFALRLAERHEALVSLLHHLTPHTFGLMCCLSSIYQGG